MVGIMDKESLMACISSSRPLLDRFSTGSLVLCLSCCIQYGLHCCCSWLGG